MAPGSKNDKATTVLGTVAPVDQKLSHTEIAKCLSRQEEIGHSGEPVMNGDYSHCESVGCLCLQH